jgi:hypothetical protein
MDVCKCITIHPALDAPDRLPCGRFSLETWDRYRTLPLGWRHGLGLFSVIRPLQIMVWDPVTGELHHLDVPPEFKLAFDFVKNPISGAVLRAAVDISITSRWSWYAAMGSNIQERSPLFTRRRLAYGVI